MNKVLFTLLLSCSATTSWCMDKAATLPNVAEILSSVHKKSFLKDSNPSDEDLTMDTESTPSPSQASSNSSSNNGSPRDDMNQKAAQRLGRIKSKECVHVAEDINDLNAEAVEKFGSIINKRIARIKDQNPISKINDTYEFYPQDDEKDIIGVVGYNGNIRPVHKDSYQKPTLPMEQRLAIQVQAFASTLKHK